MGLIHRCLIGGSFLSTEGPSKDLDLSPLGEIFLSRKFSQILKVLFPLAEVILQKISYYC